MIESLFGISLDQLILFSKKSSWKSRSDQIEKYLIDSFNKNILIFSIVLIAIENAYIIFDVDRNTQRFFSFLISLILVNILFFF